MEDGKHSFLFLTLLLFLNLELTSTDSLSTGVLLRIGIVFCITALLHTSMSETRSLVPYRDRRLHWFRSSYCLMAYFLRHRAWL